MSGVTFYPTHRCFDDVVDYDVELKRAGAPQRLLDQHVIVHGICLLPDGKPYSHAWVERGKKVYEVFLDKNGERVAVEFDRAEHRRQTRVQELTRYTLRRWLEENRRTGHYGPWVPKYFELAAERGTHDPR